MVTTTPGERSFEAGTGVQVVVTPLQGQSLDVEAGTGIVGGGVGGAALVIVLVNPESLFVGPEVSSTGPGFLPANLGVSATG